MALIIKLISMALSMLMLPFLFPQTQPDFGHVIEPTGPDIDVQTIPNIMDSYFIQNLGQMASKDILFYSRGGNVFFTPMGVTFRFREMERIYTDMEKFERTLDKFHVSPEKYRERGVVLNYTFIGANKVIPKGSERCSWNTNYFKGNSPEYWYPDIPNYYKIVYEELWNSIDLTYYITEFGIKYDFKIHPGADISRIQIEIEGLVGLKLNNRGELVIYTRYQDILDTGINAYYNKIDREKIDCSFKKINNNTFGFLMDMYDSTREVIIDPLICSTLIGGSGNDFSYSIDVDSNDNATIIGSTLDHTIDFPTSSGSFDNIHDGKSDVIVSKFNYNLSSLVFSTFIGGIADDFGFDIVLDIEFNSYITGVTYNPEVFTRYGYPTTKDAYDRTFNGTTDVFLTKLSKSGSSLIYSTLIGGNGDDEGSAIILDNLNNAYITGWTAGGFPTTEEAYDTSFNGDIDVFLSRFDGSGSFLLSSTYIGGGSTDEGNDIIISDDNSVYITGETRSINYPVTINSYDTTFDMGADVIVSRFNLNLSSLINSTFIGAWSYEAGYAIGLDSIKNVYITGFTSWNKYRNYPTTEKAFMKTGIGLKDVFVSKFCSNLTTLYYSTFISGAREDIPMDMTIDNDGNAIIVGYSWWAWGYGSSDYPTTFGAYDRFIYQFDAFITELNSNGSNLIYSTFIGGKGDDFGTGIVMDSEMNVIITGYSNSSLNSYDFPTTKGAYDRSFNGDNDVFVTKISLMVDSEPPRFFSDTSDTVATTGDPFTFRINVSDNEERINEVRVVIGFGENLSNSILMEGSGQYSKTIFIPSYTVEPMFYFFFASDTTMNENITEPKSINVSDNDVPRIVRDLSQNFGTTGDPMQLVVDVTDNIAVSAVLVEYWGVSEHLFTKLSGTDRYSVTVNVPEDTITLSYIFYAVDEAGNWNHSGKKSFSIKDNDGPFFGPDLTPNIGLTGNKYTFIADAKDNIGISDVSVEYWFGNGYHSNESMEGKGPFFFNITIPIDSLDILHYYYTIVDVNGFWNGTDVKDVIIKDDDAPVFGRETSSEWPLTGDKFDLQIVVKDNIGVKGVFVEYWFGNGESSNVSLTGYGPYSTTITVPTKSTNSLNYIYHAVDDEGNWGQTVLKTIRVYDDDRPTFGKDNTDKTCTTGDPFTFRTEVLDNIKVKEVFVEYWFGSSRPTNLSMTGTNGYVCNIMIPPSPSLTLWYMFLAVDIDGNWAETPLRKITVLDNDDPEFGTDQTPVNVNTGEQLFFKVTASDNIGIVDVYLNYRFGNGPETREKMSGLGYYTVIRSFTYQINVPIDSIETVHYTITIMDQVGNTIQRSGTVTIIDNVDPMASAGPDLIVKQGTKVIMDGSSSTDNIGITNWTWTFDDGSKKISMGGPVIEYKFDKSGTFTLKLTVNDSSGNVGTDTIAVVVERKDSERPSLLIYSVILIALSIIVIVAVSYYVAKRKMFLKKKKINK